MCGIRLVVVNNNTGPTTTTTFPKWLQRRGPDAMNQVVVVDSFCKTTLQASVLQMRNELVPQPVKIESRRNNNTNCCFYLAWNGEIYQHNSNHCSWTRDQTSWSLDVLDTNVVAQMIAAEVEDEPNDLLLLLERLGQRVFSRLINAEFAFCLLTNNAVYYGRDVLGRRSLLEWKAEDVTKNMQQDCCQFELASVATRNNNDRLNGTWTEVPPGRVFCYDWKEKTTRSCPLNQPVADQQALSVDFSSFDSACEHLETLLRDAVERRLPLSRSDSVVAVPCAVLFSGGLDSAVLAALVCRLLPAGSRIELINVSFVEQHERQNQAVSADTMAARACYSELKQLFPRHDNMYLVEKQADWNDIASIESHMRELLYPKETLMDVNIATALWFAAQATSSKLLLSGLGADEQMGGYGRHRKAYHAGTLRQELKMDMDRLWERNLGRDDRVLSDHGREARFPFLDANVVDFLAKLPLELICDFSKPPGEGDKRILRQIAKRLGLESASVAVKRAIQFGSRISHVSDKRRFGSRRKATGTKHV